MSWAPPLLMKRVAHHLTPPRVCPALADADGETSDDGAAGGSGGTVYGSDASEVATIPRRRPNAARTLPRHCRSCALAVHVGRCCLLRVAHMCTCPARASARPSHHVTSPCSACIRRYRQPPRAYADPRPSPDCLLLCTRTYCSAAHHALVPHHHHHHHTQADTLDTAEPEDHTIPGKDVAEDSSRTGRPTRCQLPVSACLRCARSTPRTKRVTARAQALQPSNRGAGVNLRRATQVGSRNAPRGSRRCLHYADAPRGLVN